MDLFSYNTIRLGLRCAKALQTVSRFPRKTRSCYAEPELSAVILTQLKKSEKKYHDD